MKGQANALQTQLLDEIVNITLKTNQSSHEDLVGAIITIDYGISNSYTWNGQEITVKIPHGIDYTINIPSIEGYKTPEVPSFTAISNNVNNVVLTYESEFLTVNTISDEGDVLIDDLIVIFDMYHKKDFYKNMKIYQITCQREFFGTVICDIM